MRQGLVPAYLALCLLLGGASAAGFVPNLLLQLSAIPLIVWGLLTSPYLPRSRTSAGPMVLSASLVLIFVLQLIPLPPGIWTHLPGRYRVADGFSLLRQPIPWLPISLAPDATLAGLLSLLPAFAVLLAVIRLGAFRAAWIAGSVILIAALNVAVGAIQVVGGDDSPWYFYRFTNFGKAVGFFANSNHTATLLICTIAFLMAVQASELKRPRSPRRTSAILLITSAAFVVIIIGLVINTSLAGLGLSVPVIGAGALMILQAQGRRIPVWSPGLVASLAVAGVIGIMAGPFGNNLAHSKESVSPLSRHTSFAHSIDAAVKVFPFGSGIGSFQAIYKLEERPSEISTTYMNHVHSDAIEIVLETGLAGLALMLAFAGWWLRRVMSIWRADQYDFYARAATITTGAIMAHSLVDYPLRTAGISALFAACCGLMAGAKPFTRIEPPAGPRARHLSAD